MNKLLTFALAATVMGSAHADAWPSKPIRIINPYVGGGASDMVARRVAQQLNVQLGVPVIVESKPGGETSIATQYVVRSPADGYTLLIGGIPAFTAQVHLAKNLPYDIQKDLTQINSLLSYPAVFVVNPDVPAKNVQEFVQYAKANPGKLNYGTVGIGNHISLAPALFRQKVNVEINDIPYKGSGQAVIDLLGGTIQFMFDTVSVPLQHIKSGKLRALATTGDTRSAVLPDIPTLKEQGVDMSMMATIAIMGPANMPPDVVKRLNAELSKAMAVPEVRASFAHLGMEPKTFDTPEAYAEFFRQSVDAIGKVVNASTAK